MSQHLLPLSIFALAAAIAFHAIAPAQAADASPAMAPKCVFLMKARTSDYMAAMNDLYTRGARSNVVPFTNTVCAFH